MAAEVQPVAPPSFEGEAARLWQRILDDPDDLAARRIFADLLLEQGNPLGESIQLATQAEELRPEDPRRAAIEERAASLRARNVVPWMHAVTSLPPLARARQPQKPRCALHRGLVEELVPTSHMLDALPLAAAVAPIRRLAVDSTFTHGDDGWHAQLAAMPTLSRIRSLELTSAREESALEVLASPHLQRLERLVLTGPATPRLAQAIAGSRVCAGLHELRLHNPGPGGIGAEGAKALASLPLRVLALGGQSIADGLSAVSGMSTLRRLAILNDPIGPAGGALLAKAPALSGLEHLTLVHCQLGRKGLVDGPLLARARTLALGNNKCGTEGGKALAAARWIEHLTGLTLHYNWMGVLGARALLERMPEAEELHLQENNYAVEPLRVAARGLLPRLRRLELWVASDEDALARWLALDDTRRLRSLRLRQAVFSDRTAELLCRLPELEDVHFTFCSFNERSLDILRERFAGVLGFWPADDIS